MREDSNTSHCISFTTRGVGGPLLDATPPGGPRKTPTGSKHLREGRGGCQTTTECVFLSKVKEVRAVSGGQVEEGGQGAGASATRPGKNKTHFSPTETSSSVAKAISDNPLREASRSAQFRSRHQEALTGPTISLPMKHTPSDPRCPRQVRAAAARISFPAALPPPHTAPPPPPTDRRHNLKLSLPITFPFLSPSTDLSPSRVPVTPSLRPPASATTATVILTLLPPLVPATAPATRTEPGVLTLAASPWWRRYRYLCVRGEACVPSHLDKPI